MPDSMVAHQQPHRPIKQLIYMRNIRALRESDSQSDSHFSKHSRANPWPWSASGQLAFVIYAQHIHHITPNQLIRCLLLLVIWQARLLKRH